MDAHVYVHSARTAGLRPPAKAHLFKQRFHFKRDRPHVRPTDAGPGVEIHPKFVRVLEIGGTNRMRVQLDTAQVDDPR